MEQLHRKQGELGTGPRVSTVDLLFGPDSTNVSFVQANNEYVARLTWAPNVDISIAQWTLQGEGNQGLHTVRELVGTFECAL
jgi:hypothetical protein